MLSLSTLPIAAERAPAGDEILAQSREELKLQYSLSVQDQGDGRVAVEFKLGDEGRLEPLHAVELRIPGEQKDKSGRAPTDLVAALDLRPAGVTRVARIEVRKEWAQRAAIWLTTASLDGNQLAGTKYHHVIPVARYMGEPPVAENSPDVLWNKMFQVMYGSLPRSVDQARLQQLKALIETGVDVNMAIGFDRMALEGETRADLRGTRWPLDTAVWQAQVDMVKLLLASGAKLHGEELAQAAFASRQEDALAMVKLLLQAGADVNSRHDGFTALFWACFRGNQDAVKLLLEEPGLKLDAISPDGDSALMAAAEHGHVEIAAMLLDSGANAAITDQRGETATTLAQKALSRQQALVEKQRAILSRLQSPPR